jgi:hypothetical protein
MAACFVIGVLLTFTFAVQQSQKLSETSFVESDTEALDLKTRRLSNSESIGASRGDEESGSVAAHLRLLGLRPGMSETTPELRDVDMVAQAELKAARMQQIESLYRDRMSTLALPAAVIFSEPSRNMPASQRFPAGFDVSLASFK